MMKPLILIPEEDTPSVLLDKENEIFEISGRLLLENNFFNDTSSIN